MTTTKLELNEEQLRALAGLQPGDVIEVYGGVNEGPFIGAITGLTLCFGTPAAGFCGAAGAYIGANIEAAGRTDISGRRVSEIVAA